MIRTEGLVAVLFDLDGTLIDSHEALWGAYSSFMQAHGVEPARDEFARLDGPSIPEIVLRLRERHALPEPLAALEAEYRALVARFYPTALPMHGADDTLVRLGRDLRLALVTSAPSILVEATLKALGWTERFAVLVTGDDGTAKPDPELYRVGLSRLGVDSENAFAVEDSVNGVRSASAAGLTVVGVAGSRERAEALQAAGAVEVVSELRELTRSPA